MTSPDLASSEKPALENLRTPKNPLRSWARRSLLWFAQVKQLHIVGCARSGTTMLHYAMAAFQDTILHDQETFVNYSPSFKESIGLFCKNLFARSKKFYVTKRSYGWWQEETIKRLAAQVAREEIYLINIVRDPRDVLTSNHKLNTRKYYVKPEVWLESTKAGQLLAELLSDYPYFLTLRYEDVVSQSDSARQSIEDKFSMKMRKELQDWSRLKDNLDAMDVKNDSMSVYMHKIRNFDPQSIGTWKSDDEKSSYVRELLSSSVYGEHLRSFMEQFNYA